LAKTKVDESDNLWFDKMPVGKNTLGNMMANISEKCGLSKRYTNHCIRSTCITVLHNNGIETRHIIGLSGHKSETSVKSYCKRLSDTKKREISTILCEQVATVSTKTSTCTSSNSVTTDVDLLSDDLEFEAILQDISNFENNPIPVSIPGNSNTCIGTSATSTPFTPCPTPFPSFAGAHGFAIGQISNSNIHFHFQQ